jgi:hypothetical protein
MNSGSAGTGEETYDLLHPRINAVGSKKARIRSGLGDQIKEMSGACSAYEMEINAYKVQVGKPEGKRPPGRSRCRWEDKILTESM